MWQYVDLILQFCETDFVRVTFNFSHYACMVELIEGYHVNIIFTFTIPPITYHCVFSCLHHLGVEILLQRSPCKLLIMLSYILSQDGKLATFNK